MSLELLRWLGFISFSAGLCGISTELCFSEHVYD